MDGYTIIVEKDAHGCLAIALDDGCNVIGMVSCPEAHDARRRLQAHLDCGLQRKRGPSPFPGERPHLRRHGARRKARR